MPERSETAFRVNAYTDPVVIQVNGKASYLNSAPVSQFLDTLIEQGKRDFLVDYKNCTSMDSTFLGIITGAALRVRDMTPPGSVTLCRLGMRNLELVRNLGLHRICNVDSDWQSLRFDSSANQTLPQDSVRGGDEATLERARMILRAHENLVQADDANLHRFQDVISFLKNQVNHSSE